MAARTSASVGVGVTITILGLLTLTLFVLTLVFYGQKTRAERDLLATQEDVQRFVRPDERERDDIRVIADNAARNNQSVVAYLRDQLQGTMERVTGLRRETLTQLQTKLRAVEGAGPATPLLEVVRNRDLEIDRLEAAAAEAEATRDVALADLANEVEKIRALEARHDATVAALNAEIEQYESELASYRQGVQSAEDDYADAIVIARQEAAEREGLLREELARVEEELLILQNQLQVLRGERKEEIFRGQPEEALVDGRVIAVNGADGTVALGLGKRDKIVLGMTFAVYADATAIRPDPVTGAYPQGKASVEIIAVDEASSTGRVLSERAGNPIVAGDVVANPVYDPNKIYRFVVFGNFDFNRDGRSTPREAEDIRAMIQSWGGEIRDELTGDVDFVVLGDPPVLPPQPPTTAPIEVLQQYVRLSEARQRYALLQTRAESTSVPILNQNRLYTLLGREAPPVRR